MERAHPRGALLVALALAAPAAGQSSGRNKFPYERFESPAWSFHRREDRWLYGFQIAPG